MCIDSCMGSRKKHEPRRAQRFTRGAGALRYMDTRCAGKNLDPSLRSGRQLCFGKMTSLRQFGFYADVS